MVKKAKSEVAYAYLKEEIIRGTFRPMETISEDELQSALQMSRTPVREAVLRLKNEGFLMVSPNKGTFVQPLTIDLIKYLYTLRRLNEPHVSYLASLKIKKEELRHLFEQNSAYIPKDREEQEESIRRDSSLHWTLLNNCGNPFLIKAMSSVYDHVDRARFIIQDPYFEEHAQEHNAILDAMLTQDQALIEKAALEHVLQSQRRAMHLLFN